MRSLDLPLCELARPVTVPVLHLGRVHRFSWWLDGDGHPSVRLSGEPAVDIERCLWKRADDGTLVCEETAARWEHPRRLTRLGAALVGLPDGTMLDLGLAESLRFSGPVVGDVWHIQSCSEDLDPDVLERALELARQCDEESFLEAGQAIDAAVRGIEEEWAGTCPYRVEGTRIVFEDAEDNRSFVILFGGEVFLATPAFQAAFPGVQDVLVERGSRATLATIGANLNQMLGIRAGDLLFEGRKSLYRRGDLTHVAWLSPEDVELADSEFAGVGYAPLGCLVAESLAGTLMRGYARPGGRAWGAVTVGISGEFIREFFSYCADGVSFTTTTLPGSEDKPERQIFKQCLPEASVAELLAAHEAELDRQGWRADLAEGELETLARAVDEFLVRFL